MNDQSNHEVVDKTIKSHLNHIRLYKEIIGIGSLPESNICDSNRGRDVIEYSRSYLDKNFALKKGSWKNIEKLELDNDKILFHLQDKTTTLIEDNNLLFFAIFLLLPSNFRDYYS